MAPESDTPGEPALSVVIVSVNGYRYLAQGLSSLARQHGRDRAEVIVVDASGDDAAGRIAGDYPWVRLIAFSTERSIPELRSIGIRAARAAIVATTQDHFIFDENWYSSILAAHRAHPHAAIGGAVESGSGRRLVDWAIYICEYAKFMLPIPPGTATDLPGPNVSYKRQILEEVCGDLLDGLRAWEGMLHERLLSRGQALWIDPSLVVHHAKTFGFWEFLTQRYYFGRSFAAARVATAPFGTRAFFVAVSLLLPPLFLWRYARCVVGKRRFVRELARAFPLLVLFAVAWSVGEFLGYGLGDGGASLRVK